MVELRFSTHRRSNRAEMCPSVGGAQDGGDRNAQDVEQDVSEKFQ